jgi:hypothetical protein
MLTSLVPALIFLVIRRHRSDATDVDALQIARHVQPWRIGDSQAHGQIDRRNKGTKFCGQPKFVRPGKELGKERDGRSRIEL